MEFSQNEYSKWYIVQALFKLMHEYEYENISVTDITNKAGVGRATFYRYFKRKEDVIIYYFERKRKDFVFSQRYYPRCRQDYIDIVKDVLNSFKQNMEPFKLIKRARLEWLYLDYLNQNYVEMFGKEHSEKNSYLPYIYAGMLFNLSMAWLQNDCTESVETLAETLVSSIYSD